MDGMEGWVTQRGRSQGLGAFSFQGNKGTSYLKLKAGKRLKRLKCLTKVSEV